MLGTRKKNYYGQKTLAEINDQLSVLSKQLNCKAIFFQSNIEGEIIDFIQEQRDKAHGILINAGPLTFNGYALRDALEDALLPVVSVHLSNLYTRKEEFRHKDIVAEIAVGGIYGFKDDSYLLGLQALITHISSSEK